MVYIRFIKLGIDKILMDIDKIATEDDKLALMEVEKEYKKGETSSLEDLKK